MTVKYFRKRTSVEYMAKAIFSFLHFSFKTYIILFVAYTLSGFLNSASCQVENQVRIESSEKFWFPDEELARLYINDILGIWEDGNGTKLHIHILNDPNYQNQGQGSKEKQRFFIAAEVEFYSSPYEDEFERWWLKNNYKVLNTVKKQLFKMDKLYRDDYTCELYQWQQQLLLVEDKYEKSVPAKLDDSGQPIEYKTVTENFWWFDRMENVDSPIMQIFSKNGDQYGFSFDFINGYLSNDAYFPEYPIPLKRTSKSEFISFEQIQPVEEDKELKYALQVTTSPQDIKPDGHSTSEINAILYSYIPGDQQSSKAVSGKTISFEINERHGIKAGRLDRSSAITDINGQVKVILTAPEAELLRNTGENVDWVSVLVSCSDPKLDELAVVGFESEQGKVRVMPPVGTISQQGFVPPDKRFPALIKAKILDADKKRLLHTKTNFSILGPNPVGMLRGPDGTEGTTIEAYTDNEGYAEVEYYYAADSPPQKRISERIEIRSEEMLKPLIAEVVTGLNIVFENVENGYEGKGLINAGEEVPIKVKIKDAWNPGLRIDEIINFWGREGHPGNERLYVKLEIKNLSSVPDYLLDQLKLESFPEPTFTEIMDVRSFKDKDNEKDKEINHLRMSKHTFGNSGGYPRIRPKITGTSYYEAQVTLVDSQGNDVFPTKHPARKAHFSLQTGMAASTFEIYFLSNPLNTETREAKLLAVALDLMGVGALLSVTDAMYKINSGDSEGLFNQLFSEIKGVMFDKVKAGSAYNELGVDLYTGMALAEKVGLEIMKDETGVLTSLENTIFNSLYNSFNWKPGQLVILFGDGNQELVIDDKENKSKTEISRMKEVLKNSTSEFDKIIAKALDKFGKSENSTSENIQDQEKSFIQDKQNNTTSLKSGNISVYIIPQDMKVSAKNAIKMKRY